MGGQGSGRRVYKPEDQPEDRDNERFCQKCGLWKGLEKFARKSSDSPHRSWTCSACRSSAARERADLARYGAKPDTATARWCGTCEEYLPFENFSFDRRGTKRKRNCNPCRNRTRREKYRATLWDGLRGNQFPDDTDTERWCSVCEQFKAKTNFYRYGRRSQRKGELFRKCKACHRAQVEDRRLVNGRGWSNPRITEEEYEERFKEQNGLCFLCERPQTHRDKYGNIKRLAIDHDHETDLNRKLLCDGCNQGLGLFGDDPQRLRAAAEYVEDHRKT